MTLPCQAVCGAGAWLGYPVRYEVRTLDRHGGWSANWKVEMMTEAVVWLVVWLILAGAGTWLAVALFSVAGVGIAAATDLIWPAPVGVALGWIAGVAWLIFSAVHVVLQVIDVVQRVIA